MKTCTSCNKVVTKGHIEFRCPNCAKSTIVRCADCKEAAKTYTCKECGFIGP